MSIRDQAVVINHEIATIHAGHDGMPNGLRYIEKLLMRHYEETAKLRTEIDGLCHARATLRCEIEDLYSQRNSESEMIAKFGADRLLLIEALRRVITSNEIASCSPHHSSTDIAREALKKVEVENE